MALKCKDKFQIPAFHAVVQEAIITYLLEPGRKHMHEEPAYEFFI